MSEILENQTGTVLSPDSNFNSVEVAEQVNNQNPFTVEKALNRLVSSTNFQFFEGKVTGNHYLIYINETAGETCSAGRIETSWGVGRAINPKPPYQRPAGQHSSKKQKGILLDFLCGERVGNIVLYERRTLQDDVVDGGQRGSIVYSFMKDKLILNGVFASKFWAYYFKYIQQGREQSHDDELRMDCNKIIKSIIQNKTIPQVKFSSLPINIKQAIRELVFDVKRIQKINFFCIETQKTISEDHADFDFDKVIEMIRIKFNKLNLQQKPVQPIHTIWGSSSVYNTTSRNYVERTPEIMSSLGYNLGVDENNNDELMRVFNDLIVRSMLNYDGKVKWGVGLTVVAENILENFYDPSDETDVMKSKNRIEKLFKIQLDEVFSSNFIDVNNKERRINLAKEIVGSGQKAIMQRLFVLSLMKLADFMEENAKYRKYIDQSEHPTNRLFNYIELLSKIISVVSMRTLDEVEYNSDERPLMKYSLMNMFNDNKILFKNLMRLGGHSQKDDIILMSTIKELVKLIDDYII
jgi:hypothetical protein